MPIDAASVRSLLRQSRSPLVRVEPFSTQGDDADHRFPLGAILGDPATQVTRIASTHDLSRWALLEVRDRIRRSHLNPAVGRASPVWHLLIGILADNFLSSQIDLDLTPLLHRFLEEHAQSVQAAIGSEDREALAGDLLSSNSRSALLRLAPVTTRLDGRDLARQLQIKLSRRPPRINPSWSSRFQHQDRPIQFWFDSTPRGPSLFVVYYTPRCSYLQCPWCSLPQLSAAGPVLTVDLFRQTDYVFDAALDSVEKDDIRTVLISNNGSVFDERTFSPTALHYAVQRACEHLPRLEVISFETRAEYCTESTLGPLRKSIDEVGRPIEFEIALGVESMDDTIRNRKLRKGLSLRAIEQVAGHLRQFKGGLRCYFMLKPVVGMTDEEALLDIEQGLNFLDSLVERYDIPVVMHLNPTYAAVGSDLAAALERGEFTPARLDRLVQFLKGSTKRRTRLHLGLNDEGLAVEGGSFIKPEAEDAIKALKRFNRTGKIAVE